MQEHQPGRTGLAGAGGKRGCSRAFRGQEAAAGDIGNPLDHAGSSAIDQKHLADDAGGRAGTSAASVATAGCSMPSVGMMTLNMN
jgi:hypothetical protein